MRPRKVVHGTDDGYGNHGCRCKRCKEAYRIAYGLRQRIRAVSLGACLIAGCDGYQYAKGYCHAHYERGRTGRSLAAPLHRKPGAQIFERTRLDGGA